MHTIHLNGEVFDYPECWEEVFNRPDPAVASYGMPPTPLGRQQGNTGVEVVKLACIGDNELGRDGWELLIKHLLGCSDDYWEGLPLGIDQWIKLKELSRWVFSEKLLVRPLDSFFCGSNKFYLADEIPQMSAMHMAAGLAYFTQMGNEDESAVDWLIAVYSPLSPSGGNQKERYNFKEIEARAGLIAGMDQWEKLVVSKYLTDTLSEFIEQRNEMFGESGEPRYQNGEGWYFSLKNLAKQGYFESIVAAENATAEKAWDLMLDDAYDNRDSQKTDN